MPRYFFDRHGGGKLSVDKVGLILVDDAEAKAEAMRRLPAPGGTAPVAAGEYRTFTTTIRDETGTPILRFLMAIAADEIGAKELRTLQRV